LFFIKNKNTNKNKREEYHLLVPKRKEKGEKWKKGKRYDLLEKANNFCATRHNIVVNMWYRIFFLKKKEVEEEHYC
jgi:hypothetical protein